MSTGYTKLFADIVTSTIWQTPNDCRVLWITLLALKDEQNICRATVPALAKLCDISIAQCEEYLQRFQEPDEYSRSQDFEGRRIERVDGGWLILNGQKYKEMLRGTERREYVRKKVAEHRARQKEEVIRRVNNGKQSKPSKPISEEEAEEEEEVEEKAEADSEKRDTFKVLPLEPSGEAPQSPVKKVRKQQAAEPWYSIFSDAYELTHQCPYKSKPGDFVQLAAVVAVTDRTIGIPWMTEERWAVAVQNYFSSDIGAHTLAGLSSRFGDFYRSPIDRYNRPIVKPASVNGAPTRRETENERRTREISESVAADYAAGGYHKAADFVRAGGAWPVTDPGLLVLESDGGQLGEGSQGHSDGGTPKQLRQSNR